MTLILTLNKWIFILVFGLMFIPISPFKEMFSAIAMLMFFFWMFSISKKWAGAPKIRKSSNE